jgi:hypothetical protein
MEQKELDALLASVDTKVTDGIKAVTVGLMKVEDFEAKLNEMEVDGLKIKELVTAVKDQGIKIKDMLDRQTENKVIKSLPEILKENEAKLKAFQSKDSKTLVMSIPLSALKTTVTINSSITTNPAGYIMPGLNDTGLPQTGLELAFQRLTLPANHNGIIRYIDLTTRTNNATYIAEGAQQSSDQTYAWTGASRTVEKVLATVPVSWESLNDSTEMDLAIRRLLTADAETIRQTQIYTGSGTAPQIAGVYSVFAQTFDHAAHTSPLVSAANIYDLVMLMKEQVALNYGSKFMPDVVLMNPSDALKAKWTKDELGNYVRNPFVSPDGMTVAGMRIIESYYVTANTLVVGDSRYAYYYQGENAEIELGYDGSNFTYDLITMKARLRHALVIRTADAYGWLKCTDISAALGAITTLAG